MLASRYGIMNAYLVSLQVTTSIESYCLPVHSSVDRGSLTTKSIAIDFYGLSEVVGDFSCPYRACLADLFCIHVS